jgi:5-methyltetrahydrofolate--homocysteine methyltransferase
LYDAFREQAVALEEGGADAIVIETMTDLEEAVLAVRAAREHTRIPVFCTMTFDKLVTGDYRSMMGVSPAEMVGPLIDAGASVIGANCGNGIEGMVSIVQGNQKYVISIFLCLCMPMPVCRFTRMVIPFFPESPSEEWQGISRH